MPSTPWGLLMAGDKPVGLPPLRERPETPSRLPDTAASWITANLLRPAWLWRRETLLGLVWAGCAAVPLVLVEGWVPAVGAVLVVWGVLLGLMLAPGVRPRLARWVRLGRVRREWDNACRFAQVETVSLRVPRITEIEEYAAGERLVVRLPRGVDTEALSQAADKIAVVLDVREVRVDRDPERARWPRVELSRRNPFRDESGTPALVSSPLTDASYWSLWDGVPVGIDAVGAVKTIGIVGKNILIGGEPEAGKSVAASQLLAAAALDSDVRILGLDAKMVELSLWEPVLERVAYHDKDDVLDLLQFVAGEMDARYEKFAAEKIRSIAPGLFPLMLLAVDELRFFTAHPEKSFREKFNGLLIDVVARGRAAGIITLLATQKPGSDVVPTALRDLLAYRWALRCSTRDASDTILGAGWSTEGHSAASIDPADRGLGLLLAEGGTPEEIKSAYLSDDDIMYIAKRGAALRGVV